MKGIKQLATAGTKVRTKYRLSEYIGQYAGRKEMRDELKELIGISDVAFSNWENMAIDDVREIRARSLKLLANYFGKDISEMTN